MGGMQGQVSDMEISYNLIKELQKELARVKRERDILKKATAIFSHDQNPYSGS